MSNNDAVIEFLLNQLRQQLTNNPYKQQCEDLAHEVLSLKNQLRDASALVAELQEDNIKKSEHISHLTGQVKDLHMALVKATGDAEAYKLIRKGGYAPEQSGCRKEDTQECEHDWIIMPGLFLSEGNPNNVPGSELCLKCGKREWDDAGCKPKEDTQECYHNWRFVGGKSPAVCINCGVTKPEECEHEWYWYNRWVK